MDRRRWSAIVDRLIGELRAADCLGRTLDVRENVNFLGGEFPRWIHTTFPDSACAIAIEVKKFYMDEWTGEAEPRLIAAIGKALQRAAAGVLVELKI
jgi:hypothetical protein